MQSGKPLTASVLARLLKPFGIRRRQVRLDESTTLKGYLVDQFDDAFERYLPPFGSRTETAETTTDHAALRPFRQPKHNGLFRIEKAMRMPMKPRLFPLFRFKAQLRRRTPCGYTATRSFRNTTATGPTIVTPIRATMMSPMRIWRSGHQQLPRLQRPWLCQVPMLLVPDDLAAARRSPRKARLARAT